MASRWNKSGLSLARSLPCAFLRLLPYHPRIHACKRGGFPSQFMNQPRGHGHTARAPPGVSLPSGSRTRNLRILATASMYALSLFPASQHPIHLLLSSSVPLSFQPPAPPPYRHHLPLSHTHPALSLSLPLSLSPLSLIVPSPPPLPSEQNQEYASEPAGRRCLCASVSVSLSLSVSVSVSVSVCLCLCLSLSLLHA
jgi:hypothetical protein